MGDLTNVVKRYVPSSYRAMITRATENSSDYTIDDLQAIANYVQFRFLATIAGSTSEAAVYDPRLLEWLGKVTTVKFIPAAIDYWMDQQETVQTTGSNETESFAARLGHLRELYAEMSADVAEEYLELIGIYPLQGKKGHVPLVSYDDNGRGILRTPDPQCEPQPGDRYTYGTDFPWTLP